MSITFSRLFISKYFMMFSDEVTYPSQVSNCGWYPSSRWLWEHCLFLLLLPPATSVHHLHLPHCSHDHSRRQKCTSSLLSWSHKALFQPPQELTGTVWVRSSSKYMYIVYMLHFVLCKCCFLRNNIMRNEHTYSTSSIVHVFLETFLSS